jgi:O-antigen/teichoic acid export membrane protein
MSGRTYLPPADVSISVPGDDGDTSVAASPAAPEAPLLANVQYGIVSRVWALVLALATTPLLLHGLGAERFGVWVLLSAIAGYLTYFDFGIGVALAQLVAMDMPRAPEETRRMVGTGTWLSVLLAVFLAAVALLARPLLFRIFPLGGAGRQEADTAYILIVAAFSVLAACASFQAVLIGKGKLRAYYLTSMAIATLQLAGIVAVIRLRGGLRELALNSLVWSSVGALVWIWLARRALPGMGMPRGMDARRARRLLGFGWKVQITNVAAFALQYVDRLIVGSLLGAIAVSRYEVGARVGNVSRLLSSPVGLAVLPRASRQFGRGDGEGLRRLAVAGTRLLTIACLLVAGPLAAGAPFLLRVWLGQFHPDSVRVLATLSAVAAFHSSSGVLSAIARGIGSPGLETRYTMLLVLALVFGGVAATAAVGLTGLLVCSGVTTVALTLYFGAVMAAVLKIPRRELFLRPVAIPWAMGFAAAGLASICGRAASTHLSAFSLLLLVGAAFEVCFLGLCLAVGALRWSEVCSPFTSFRSFSSARDQ